MTKTGIISRIELDQRPATASLSAFASDLARKNKEVQAVVMRGLSDYAAGLKTVSVQRQRELADLEERRRLEAKMAAERKAAVEAEVTRRRDTFQRELAERRELNRLMNGTPTADVGRSGMAGKASLGGAGGRRGPGMNLMSVANIAQDFQAAGVGGILNNVMMMGKGGAAATVVYLAGKLGYELGSGFGNVLGERMTGISANEGAGQAAFTGEAARRKQADVESARTAGYRAGISASDANLANALAGIRQSAQMDAAVSGLREQLAGARLGSGNLSGEAQILGRADLGMNSARTAADAAVKTAQAEFDRIGMTLTARQKEVHDAAAERRRMEDEQSRLEERVLVTRKAYDAAKGKAGEAAAGSDAQKAAEAMARLQEQLRGAKDRYDALTESVRGLQQQQAEASRGVSAAVRMRAEGLPLQLATIQADRDAALRDERQRLAAEQRQKDRGRAEEFMADMSGRSDDFVSAGVSAGESMIRLSTARRGAQMGALSRRRGSGARRALERMRREDTVSSLRESYLAAGMSEEEATATAEGQAGPRRGRLSVAESEARRAGRTNVRRHSDRDLPVGASRLDYLTTSGEVGDRNFPRLNKLAEMQRRGGDVTTTQGQPNGAEALNATMEKLVTLLAPMSQILGTLGKKEAASPLRPNN